MLSTKKTENKKIVEDSPALISLSRSYAFTFAAYQTIKFPYEWKRDLPVSHVHSVYRLAKAKRKVFQKYTNFKMNIMVGVLQMMGWHCH